MQAKAKGFLIGCLFGALVGGVCGVSAKVKAVKQFLNTVGEKPPGYTHVVTSPPGKTILSRAAVEREAMARCRPILQGRQPTRSKI